MMKVEAELMDDGETKKRRWDLKNMEFDPNVNLKDPSKYKKKVVKTVSKNDNDDVYLEYKIQKGIVN